MAANKRDIFDRLIGLETEYALHLRSLESTPGRTNRYALFRQFLDSLRERTCIATARHMKEGAFLANGGAVWFETERPASGGGLIEGATPECRTPRQLVQYQRAQDSLLSEAAADVTGLVSFRLIKNDRDAVGNVYGAQENYEVVFATGWRLWLWRMSLVLIFPLVVFTWIGLWLMVGCVLAYGLFASIVYLASAPWMKKPANLAIALFGGEFENMGEGLAGPVWLESLLAIVSRVWMAPLAALLQGILWCTAFTKIRRQILPFLVTRGVVCGAGMVDEAGRFLISDKAPAINSLTGYGGFLNDRPMFSFGHLFKALCSDGFLAPREYLSLFSHRQRFQIALGDSNMAETAEYLRVATTLLVIDAIEAGEMPSPPRIRRPLRALRQICHDFELTGTIAVAGGAQVRALDIQRFYLDACCRFVERRPEAPAEARRVLTLWEETLDALEHDPESLIGVLDWPTKRFLLDKAGHDASWAQKKKIDIRYHELSPDGYFEMLKTTNMVATIVDDSDIAHARRNPPHDSPAAVRSRYIREFSGGDEPLAVNWRYVFLGRGFNTKVIPLRRYQAGPKRAVRPNPEEMFDTDGEE